MKLELERADILSQVVDFGCLPLALTRIDFQFAIQLKNLLVEFMNCFSVFIYTNGTVCVILLVGFASRFGEIFVRSCNSRRRILYLLGGTLGLNTEQAIKQVSLMLYKVKLLF